MRLEAFIVRRAFALKFFTLFRFSFVGYLQNFDNACLRCFMASLHSSLYHGLLFFGFVEVFGILLLAMSRREDDDEFRFNDASTHEGHLRQNGELTWFCSETIIMISHKCIKCKTRTNLKIKAVILC